MTKQEAIVLLLQSENALRQTRIGLATNDLSFAKERFAEALRVLDNTCAIQLDTLT